MDDTLIRPAEQRDIPAIVALLADDRLGRSRESLGDLAPYHAAFEAIQRDPNQLLVVLDHAQAVAGTLQLSFMPGLSRKGAWRCEIEAVRIDSNLRSRGLGEMLIQWAIEQARSRGCGLVQLTSDNTRADAHRFYQRLGFAQSHKGFKLTL